MVPKGPQPEKSTKQKRFVSNFLTTTNTKYSSHPTISDLPTTGLHKTENRGKNIRKLEA
jgi:hypothetical protein